MKLPEEEVRRRLSGLNGWTLTAGALEKRYTFRSFPDALGFVTRLGFDAEAADHHPDLQVSYKKVTVRWNTHSDEGITEKDFAGVTQSDTIAKTFAP